MTLSLFHQVERELAAVNLAEVTIEHAASECRQSLSMLRLCSGALLICAPSIKIGNGNKYDPQISIYIYIYRFTVHSGNHVHLQFV